MTADFLFCRPGAVAQFRPGAVVRLRRGAKLRRRLAVALYLLAGAAAACEVQEGMAPAADSGSLVVLESQLEKVARGDGSVVATLVSLRNTAASCADDVVLQARYFDAGRKLIDSATGVFRGIVVPPGKTVTYRLDSPPLRPLADYVTQEVTVVDARPLYRPGAPRGTFLSERVVWLPFLLAMPFVLAVAYCSRGRRLRHRRMLALAERQAELQDQQTRQLQRMQRIADALETRMDSNLGKP
ncbi:hypothetical protein [Tahibacter harae]|uniref:Uncharacterized protein n=1 Tax=Tahibacter harae TaxID=2963937 RepID=A0ABT1QR16_9GAMM|nr:hypothetical protein [Tahibacter harae]MCQ4164746.1 hypothetical protein [Tahibacter harae]